MQASMPPRIDMRVLACMHPGMQDCMPVDMQEAEWHVAQITPARKLISNASVTLGRHAPPPGMPGAYRPSVTVLVEIHAGVIWDACRGACLPSVTLPLRSY